MSEDIAPAPSPAQPPAAPPHHAVDRRELVISFGSMLLFDIGLNLLIFQVARANGVSEVGAYLLAGIGPLVGLAIEWIRHRRLSAFSLFILAINVISAIVAVVGSTDPRWLIIKDSFFTGAIGLVVLGSLLPLAPRPLMFYLGQKFATDGSDEGVAYWNDLWQRYPAFRASQRLITAIWGVAFLLEAAIRIVAAETLPFDDAYTVGQILPLAVVAVAITATIVIARRSRRRGERARAAAAAADQTA